MLDSCLLHSGVGSSFEKVVHDEFVSFSSVLIQILFSYNAL